MFNLYKSWLRKAELEAVFKGEYRNFINKPEAVPKGDARESINFHRDITGGKLETDEQGFDLPKGHPKRVKDEKESKEMARRSLTPNQFKTYEEEERGWQPNLYAEEVKRERELFQRGPPKTVEEAKEMEKESQDIGRSGFRRGAAADRKGRQATESRKKDPAHARDHLIN